MRGVDVVNPRNDYVPPEYVTIIITNRSTAPPLNGLLAI